jgi:hypothetical protein
MPPEVEFSPWRVKLNLTRLVPAVGAEPRHSGAMAPVLMIAVNLRRLLVLWRESLCCSCVPERLQGLPFVKELCAGGGASAATPAAPPSQFCAPHLLWALLNAWVL